MKNKNITIDKLATMVQKGFNDVTDKMATKLEMEAGFKKVSKRFDNIDKRLDRIEHTILEKHADEIKYLKERVSKLEEALAIE